MKKTLIPLISATVAFILITLIPFKSLLVQDKITLELNIQVLEEDCIQVFYMQNGVMFYSEENSVINCIKGDSNFQKLEFVLPLDKPINEFRIDLGQNINQKPIIIKSAKFKSLIATTKINTTTFTTNNYVSNQNDKYYTKVLPELEYPYDPYIRISNDKLLPILNEFKQKQSQNWIFSFYLIAFLLSVVVFIITYKNKTKAYEIISNFYFSLFLAIIFTPLIVKKLDLEKDTVTNEKRVLAQKPEFKINKEFPIKYENYYNDNFALRKYLIKWASKIKVEIFKVSSKPDLVLFGKKGYLFFNNQYQINTNTISDKNIDEAYQKQSNEKEKFAKQGIKYILCFWPSKRSIYDESLPFSMKLQEEDTSLTDKVVNRFNKESLFLIDVRKDMLDAKKNTPLYYKFDTHWNNNGAYEAYRSFCKQTFHELGLVPFNIDDFSILENKVNHGDLTYMLGLDSMSNDYDDFPIYNLKDLSKGYNFINLETFPPKTIITINENCSNNKVVLVFRDSFVTALQHFLSLHYGKIVYIWNYPLDSHQINKDAIIEQVKPDIIINCSAERYLPDLLHL